MPRCLTLLLAIFGMIYLSGCAGNVTWTKHGLTPEQMRADFGLCGGSFTSSGTPRYTSEYHLAGIDACMHDKGYVRLGP